MGGRSGGRWWLTKTVRPSKNNAIVRLCEVVAEPLGCQLASRNGQPPPTVCGVPSLARALALFFPFALSFPPAGWLASY